MFKLQLEEVDLRVPLEGGDAQVAGRVWAVLGVNSFPEAGWRDFPISVLSSAVDAFRDLSQGASEAFSYFFDGPYYLYYRMPSIKGSITIEANTDRSGSPELLASAEIQLSELRDTLLRSAESAMAAFSMTEDSRGADSVVAKIVDFLRMTEVV